MNFRALEKSIQVLEKSWKFESEKGMNPELLSKPTSSPDFLLTIC